MSRRVVMALKVMCNMDIAEHRRPQDGRIEEKYASGNEAELNIDMRVSTLPCVNGEKAVIRLLPRENPFTQLSNLGFVPDTMNAYKAWLEENSGCADESSVALQAEYLASTQLEVHPRRIV